MIIQDCWALPVEGTETRVNAHSQAYEYMSKYMEDIRSVDRLENAIGWYHSHPGYGCWLSGIDVSTQKLHQQYEGKITHCRLKFRLLPTFFRTVCCNRRRPSADHVKW